MHRIPLLIPIQSICWDRDLSECCLFEITLNKSNVEQTNSFLTLLDSEAETYKKHSYKIAENMYSAAHHSLMDSDSCSEAMFFFSYIILRSPKDSPTLATALKLRGIMHYYDSFFEQATNDFEMYLEVYKYAKALNEDVCEVHGHLVTCMYMKKKFSKLKKYYKLYKKYKAKLPQSTLKSEKFGSDVKSINYSYITFFITITINIDTTTNLNPKIMTVKIEKDVKDLIREVENFENIVPTSLKVHSKDIPYKGFTSCAEIPAASSICLYQKDGIYVKEDVERASVLFVEDPILQSVNVPLLDCDVCYNFTQRQLYSCLECRYKTYCSLSCLKKDKKAHSDECIGFAQLTIPLLDASTIFRAFVRISNKLHETIFNPEVFRNLREAEEVWDKIHELLKDKEVNEFRDFELIRTKPTYDLISDMQYSTLVATAFRLTIFIEKKTHLIDKFYEKLHISNKQKLIVIGALLMRIHGNILLNSFDFEITRTNSMENEDNSHLSIQSIAEMMMTITRRNSTVKDIDKFYDIDFKRDVWLRSDKITIEKRDLFEVNISNLTLLRHVKPCHAIHRILATYKDNIAQLYFQSDLTPNIIYGRGASDHPSISLGKILCSRIQEMWENERYIFVRTCAYLFHIHYADYFLQKLGRDPDTEQVLTLYCPTLRKFNHSCDPNIEVMVLNNGTVLGKALKKIKSGEQLHVSYKVNYMRNIRIERQKLLNQFNVACKCSYCKMNEYEEPTNKLLEIKCETCKFITITPSQGFCPSCQVQHVNLFTKYRNIIYVLQTELKKELTPSLEREVYNFHLILCTYSKMYFPPQNEIRISIELKMGHFLAVQNFAEQAYNLIKNNHNAIVKYYDQNLVLFTFYSEMLLVIKIILFNNLEDSFRLLDASDLRELCSLGLYIAEAQKDYIEFYEVFDALCSNILEDIKMLLTWRDKLKCSEMLLSDSN